MCGVVSHSLHARNTMELVCDSAADFRTQKVLITAAYAGA